MALCAKKRKQLPAGKTDHLVRAQLRLAVFDFLVEFCCSELHNNELTVCDHGVFHNIPLVEYM